jgi:hypothetical protein
MQVRKLIMAVMTTVAVCVAPTLMIAAGATAAPRTERFSFADTSTSAGPPSWSVIATGDFTAGGKARAEGKGLLLLNFPSGTITLRTTKHHRKVSKDQTATACIQTATSSGNYTIAGGTGAYHGISGSGRSTVDNTFVEQVVNGHCSNAFTAVQSLITASGPVSLP